MVYTHHGFKSLRPDVRSAEDVLDEVGTALVYQHLLEKRTTPWEMSEWQDGELDNFFIEVENVDRVYHLYHYDDGVSGRDFAFSGRMDHPRGPLYFKLTAGCDYTGFECQGGGDIYVTLDPQLYLKSVLELNDEPQKVWQAMKEDDLAVDEPDCFDVARVGSWTTVPMLKFLCHMAVYDAGPTLSHYPEVMPAMVTQSLEEFIKTREARNHYDSID